VVIITAIQRRCPLKDSLSRFGGRGSEIDDLGLPQYIPRLFIVAFRKGAVVAFDRDCPAAAMWIEDLVGEIHRVMTGDILQKVQGRAK